MATKYFLIKAAGTETKYVISENQFNKNFKFGILCEKLSEAKFIEKGIEKATGRNVKIFHCDCGLKVTVFSDGSCRLHIH